MSDNSYKSAGVDIEAGNGHGFGWTPAVGDGQGGLVC